VSDPVNKPAHYTAHPSGVECIQIAEHMGFCLGNAVKYIWRADLKGDAIEDLRKARWYIDREIERREAAAAPDTSVNGGPVGLGDMFIQLSLSTGRTEQALVRLNPEEPPERRVRVTVGRGLNEVCAFGASLEEATWQAVALLEAPAKETRPRYLHLSDGTSGTLITQRRATRNGQSEWQACCERKGVITGAAGPTEEAAIANLVAYMERIR